MECQGDPPSEFWGLHHTQRIRACWDAWLCPPWPSLQLQLVPLPRELGEEGGPHSPARFCSRHLLVRKCLLPTPYLFQIPSGSFSLEYSPGLCIKAQLSNGRPGSSSWIMAGSPPRKASLREFTCFPTHLQSP